MRKIVLSENLRALATLPDAFAQLIYVDPPFNTGRAQTRERIKVVRDDAVTARLQQRRDPGRVGRRTEADVVGARERRGRRGAPLAAPEDQIDLRLARRDTDPADTALEV